jgi:diaminopimelate decarboxylase
MNQTPKKPTNRHALLEAARTFGTPAVVYLEDIVRARCQTFRDAIGGVPSKLLYALKANSNPALLEVVGEYVDGFDAVSPGEVDLLLRLGVDARSILYSPNYMTDEEMGMASDQRVIMNIGELSRLERFGSSNPGAPVCVRLNLWLGAGHHEYVVTGGKQSKFGVPGDQLDRVVSIAARHNLRIVGLHQHIGSGFSSSSDFGDALNLLVEASKLFPEVEFLNVGGGIGIPYRSDEPSFDLRSIDEHLLEAKNLARTGIEFWFEPGRFLVAESGALLVTVTAVKQTGDKVFAGTDSGFNHLVRPILYGAHHEVFNLTNPTGPLRRYDVAGNICESGDLFARDRHVQEVRQGDVLAILDVGAYGLSMASEYNMRPLPEEVLVGIDGSMRSVRRRMSAAQLVDRYLAETVGAPPQIQTRRST